MLVVHMFHSFWHLNFLLFKKSCFYLILVKLNVGVKSLIMRPKVFIVFNVIIFRNNANNISFVDNIVCMRWRNRNPYAFCVCLAMIGHCQMRVSRWLTNGVNVTWPVCHSSNLSI